MIYRTDVVYTDPLDHEDVITVVPHKNKGVIFGAIAATQGARFRLGASITGKTVSIYVKPGDEPRLLAAIGDNLRREELHRHPDNRTIVSTYTQLRARLMSLDLPEAVIKAVMGVFTTAQG